MVGPGEEIDVACLLPPVPSPRMSSDKPTASNNSKSIPKLSVLLWECGVDARSRSTDVERAGVRWERRRGNATRHGVDLGLFRGLTGLAGK